MNKILLVEDDEALALGVEYTLKEEGYDTHRVSTIKDGKAVIDSNYYDLILLDINLPDGSGYDLCKYIKTSKDIPIIFLTALDEEVNVVLGLDLGGDDYITKPFRVRELLSRIRVVLRRNTKLDISGGIIISEKIEVNTSLAEVKKDDYKILLTAKEYKLLLTFLKHPNELLSKDFILNEIFDDEGVFVEDNTLSVYIKRLREKVENNPSKPEYIINKRGLGYIWTKEVKGKM
ncbi:MAG: response regulator transcription factor [Clostridium sp.]|nr:response regulator transcription factor [Clostridium sp.]